MRDRLKVVLDTNVLLVSISSKSKYHWIYDKLVADEYDLFITNEILMEYEEIISLKYNSSVARDVIKSLLLLLKRECHRHAFKTKDSSNHLF